MSQTGPTFAISDLAREFDITPRTIRFWEDQGILAPQREGSKRIFTRRDRARLKMALRGKRLGLSLAEIKDLIGMYSSTEDERRNCLNACVSWKNAAWRWNSNARISKRCSPRSPSSKPNASRN